MGKASTRNDGTETFDHPAPELHCMAALGLALFALGPMADAQTTSSIPTAQNAKSKSDAGKAADAKDANAKDSKSKDAKSKDKSSKDPKSKDAKNKDAKSKNAKDAKSDPKAGKAASKSSETTVAV